MKYVFYISKSNPGKWTTYRRDAEQRRGDAWHLPKGKGRAERFDVPRILAKLQGDAELREKSEGRCQFRQVFIDGRKASAICAITDYLHARAVACSLRKLLYDEPDVSLFDAERGMKEISCKSDLPDEAFVIARQAYRRYRAEIIHKFLPQWPYAATVGYYKIAEDFTGFSLRLTASVTALAGSFEDCVRRFDSVLNRIANELGDEVYCCYSCFSVCHKETYTFNFVLEGMGKNPDRIGWMENGAPKVELLHRRGIWQTRREVEKLPEGEFECLLSRLDYQCALVADSCERNLADRFVNSYKVSKIIAKHGLDIQYGESSAHYHSLVAFWLHDDGWYSKDASLIRFADEDQACVILGVIGEIVPTYWKHYYDEFLVRPEETRQIVERMKEVREIVRKNPCDPTLGNLVENLERSSFADNCGQFYEGENYDEVRHMNLFKRRYDIVALCDIFIPWLDYAAISGFYVVGP